MGERPARDEGTTTHVIETTQLLIWQVICTAGLMTALLSLRFRVLILTAVTHTGQDGDLVEGARQNRDTALVQTLGWLGFFGLGILAVVDMPAPQLTTDATLLGQAIGWLLIVSIGIWAYMTVSVYAYALRKWWESPISSRPDSHDAENEGITPPP